MCSQSHAEAGTATSIWKFCNAHKRPIEKILDINRIDFIYHTATSKCTDAVLIQDRHLKASSSGEQDNNLQQGTTQWTREVLAESNRYVEAATNCAFVVVAKLVYTQNRCICTEVS